MIGGAKSGAVRPAVYPDAFRVLLLGVVGFVPQVIDEQGQKRSAVPRPYGIQFLLERFDRIEAERGKVLIRQTGPPFFPEKRVLVRMERRQELLGVRCPGHGAHHILQLLVVVLDSLVAIVLLDQGGNELP